MKKAKGDQLVRKKINLHRRSPAFTLVELLIALALTGMAISVIGGIIISQLRENVAQERQKQLVDDWSQVANFINEDIFSAERAYPIEDSAGASRVINLASNGVCGFSSEQIKLSLVRADASTYITYAVVPVTNSDITTWRGPYLLKRCGPLNTNGEIEGTTRSATLTGNLSSSSAFSANRGMNALGGALAARDVRIRMTLSEGSISHSGELGGQARVSPSYNLFSDERTTGSSCGLSSKQTALLCGSGVLEFTQENCPEYLGTAITRSSVTNADNNCGLSRVHQYKPSGDATIIGSSNSTIEDAIYFPNNVSDYTISAPCDRTSCTISSPGGTVSITQGNVLIFLDREIRL